MTSGKIKMSNEHHSNLFEINVFSLGCDCHCADQYLPSKSCVFHVYQNTPIYLKISTILIINFSAIPFLSSVLLVFCYGFPFIVRAFYSNNCSCIPRVYLDPFAGFFFFFSFPSFSFSFFCVLFSKTNPDSTLMCWPDGRQWPRIQWGVSLGHHRRGAAAEVGVLGNDLHPARTSLVREPSNGTHSPAMERLGRIFSIRHSGNDLALICHRAQTEEAGSQGVS